jgi:hypothetical protein
VDVAALEARQPMPSSYLDLDAAAPAVDHLTDIRTVLRDEPRRAHAGCVVACAREWV